MNDEPDARAPAVRLHAATDAGDVHSLLTLAPADGLFTGAMVSEPLRSKAGFGAQLEQLLKANRTVTTRDANKLGAP